MSKKTNSHSQSGFARFELHPLLARGLRSAGFDEPRPIQVDAIPPVLDGRDVLGLAQTGTGKTAAFALPILDQLLRARRGGPSALILAPTRELATQISNEIGTLGKFTKVRVVTIFGGVSARRQISALRRGPEIVVGCPGRVLDLLRQGDLKLGGVDTLVLDEADHMFDMGFLPDVRKILAALPSRRQNLLFSATMPKEIRHLADRLLRDPSVVDLAGRTPAKTIDHALLQVAEKKKKALLEHMLASNECDSAIVFTRTKHRARRLAAQLTKLGHRAVGLQGNMSQNQRDRAMKGFRSGTFDVLVATDIAARGIDVSGVSHVINFDVPNTPEAYTHRIGRTGRSEQSGVARTFVTATDRDWVRSTERMIGARIPRLTLEGLGLEGLGFEGVGGEGSGRDGLEPSRGKQPDRPPREGHQRPTRRRRRSSRRRVARGGENSGRQRRQPAGR